MPQEKENGPAWTRLLTQVLQVRPTELHSFLLLAGVFFSIQLVDGMLDVLAISSFVGNVGVYRLPYLALLEGTLLMLLGNFYMPLVDRWPKPWLLTGLFLTYGLLLCGVRGLVAWGRIPFATYSLLYMLRWQMDILLVLVFWAVVSDTYTLSAANRLVPIIAGLGFLGKTTGNKLAGESGHILTSYGLLPDDLLLIVAVFLGLTALALWWLNRRARGLLRLTAGGKGRAARISLRDTFQRAPRFIKNVRIFSLLAIITFLSTLCGRTVVFQFLALSKSVYADNLAFQTFYGNVRALLQVILFLLQLLVVNRIFARVGAATALLAIPLVFAVSGLLFGLMPGLWSGLIAMCASEVSYKAFERPSRDVLFTLVPQRMKGRVAMLINTFTRPAGSVVSGGLLLLLIRLAEIGWLQGRGLDRALGALLLACALACLAAIELLRRNYATYLLDWRLARRKRQIPDWQQWVEEIPLQKVREATQGEAAEEVPRPAVPRRPWAFGLQGLGLMVAGALLYGFFSWVTDFLGLSQAGYIPVRPAKVVLVLAGLLGGPLVGFGTGFFGNILGDALTLETMQFWWNWHIANGLIGLSGGLFGLLGWRYRNGRDLLKLLGGVALAEVIGLGLAAVAELTLPTLQAAIAADTGLASAAQVTARLIVGERFLPAVLSDIAMQGLLLPPVPWALRSQLEKKGWPSLLARTTSRGSLMSTNDVYQRTFEGGLEQLATIRAFVAQAAANLGADEDALFACQLAADEAATNAFQHAYGGRGGRVEVGVRREGEAIVLWVRNWGTPFDPTAIPEPDLYRPPEERTPGGLGLFLIRQVMDQVSFEFDPQEGNTITMRRRIT